MEKRMIETLGQLHLHIYGRWIREGAARSSISPQGEIA
jgi:hypothetical protein